MAQSKVEKIASIEQEIKQLKERQKQLQQQHNLQERKDRTKRLCRRMGLFESMLPDTIPLTDEQFKTFLEKTILTDMAYKTLAEIASYPSYPIQTRRSDTERRRGTGAGRGQRRKAERITLPLSYPKGAFIYHMNVVCAVLQTAFCAYRHKRKRRELPAERSSLWHFIIAPSILLAEQVAGQQLRRLIVQVQKS